MDESPHIEDKGVEEIIEEEVVGTKGVSQATY